MAYAIVNTSGDRDYHNAVVQFLEAIEEDTVHGVAMVAICDSGPYLSWLSTPTDFAAMASVMQSQATLNFMDGADEDEDFD